MLMVYVKQLQTIKTTNTPANITIYVHYTNRPMLGMGEFCFTAHVS